MMDRPIFILGCTKSGTTLMRNLFDGHPDLFVVPFESHFFQNTGRWVEYSYRRTGPRRMSVEEKKEGLISWIDFCNKRDNPIADGFSVNRLDVDAAAKFIRQTTVSDERELSDLYSKAIYLAVYGKEMPAHLNFVEKSVENAELSTVWRRLYPEARFVHILRNPYSNLVAMRKYGAHNRKGSYPRLQNALQAMQNSYYWLYRNLEEIPNYHVVRYEDLISDVEKVMRQLSNDIDLEYADVLSTPTNFGEQWKGNSTSGKTYSGISNKNVTAWKKDITSLEVKLVNAYFPHVLSDFGFDKEAEKGSWLAPGPKEGPGIWAYNRLLSRFA